MSGRKKADARRGIDRLLEVVTRLRGDGGCPWDREQTLESLKQPLIEESYEVIDAIDSNDPTRHEEELGDLLLQIAMQSQIRAEKGDFTFDDVAGALADKLVRRHPHVFGKVKVSGTKEVLKNWETIKSKEKKTGNGSVVGEVPRYLPALQKAQKIQTRVARVGFDWAEIKDVIAKVEEELAETREAIAESNNDRRKEEIGDLLFAVVNLSRFLKINAEEAMDHAICRFVRRFQQVERRIQAEGRQLKDCTLADMEAHWQAVKNEE